MVFFIPKIFKLFGFQIFDFECTWWRLFWAYLMNAIPAYLMKAIPAYLMKAILSVPDEGYSDRTWWRLFWAYLMKAIPAYPMKAILSVPDEGYSERTWWRLFWAYLMKAIPETRSAHYIWYLRFYYCCQQLNVLFVFIMQMG